MLEPRFFVTGPRSEGLQQNPSPQRRSFGHQRGSFNHHAIGRWLCNLRVSARSQLVEPVGVFTDEIGGPGDRRSCGAAGAIQFRQDRVPDAVAWIAELGVRLVLRPAFPALSGTRGGVDVPGGRVELKRGKLVLIQQ